MAERKRNNLHSHVCSRILLPTFCPPLVVNETRMATISQPEPGQTRGSHFERPSVPSQARATISNGSVAPSQVQAAISSAPGTEPSSSATRPPHAPPKRARAAISNAPVVPSQARAAVSNRSLAQRQIPTSIWKAFAAPSQTRTAISNAAAAPSY